MDSVSILGARDANKEIIGLNVSVNERFVMDSLYTRNLGGAIVSSVQK